MKSKMKMATLAALVMACSAGAFAEGNSVEFKTSIQVVGADNCGIDVAAAGKNSWALNWVMDKAAAETGTLAMGADSDVEPLFVKVKVRDDSAAACALWNMKFGASLPAAASHLNDGDKGAFKVATQNGGFWRYMPVVAKLAAFTDVRGVDDATTGAVALDKIKVTDAAKKEHTQSTAAAHNASTELTDVADFGSKPAMTLTNNYLAANGVAPLSVGAGNTDLSFKAELGKGQSIKGALIGVGAVVAKNPEDAEGEVKLDAVANGEKVSLPFTINVDNA